MRPSAGGCCAALRWRSRDRSPPHERMRKNLAVSARSSLTRVVPSRLLRTIERQIDGEIPGLRCAAASRTARRVRHMSSRFEACSSTTFDRQQLSFEHDLFGKPLHDFSGSCSQPSLLKAGLSARPRPRFRGQQRQCNANAEGRCERAGQLADSADRWPSPERTRRERMPRSRNGHRAPWAIPWAICRPP